MKKSIYIAVVILAAFVCLLSCKSSKIDRTTKLEGSWRLIEASQVENIADITNIKNFTKTHFSWQSSNNAGVVRSAASGTYIIQDNYIFETIEQGTSGMKSFIGTTAKIQFSIKNDTLTYEGTMPNKFKFTEKWVRVK